MAMKGIRVPLIIKMPGKTKPGLKTKQPVLSTDLYPTILDLLDLPLIPEHRDGLSLKKFLNGEEKTLIAGPYIFTSHIITINSMTCRSYTNREI